MRCRAWKGDVSSPRVSADTPRGGRLLVLADGTFALSLALLVALLSLGVLRLIDPNEKEPLWGLAVALLAGLVAAGILTLVVDSEVLELEILRSSLARGAAIFAAIAAAIGAFSGIARVRGWSEVNGVLDGIVYGAAVGLGFATGEAFADELAAADFIRQDLDSGFGLLWTTLLNGLAYGLFGAIIGAGFGASVEARARAGRVAYPIIGLAAAVVLMAAHRQLATGDALGDRGELRSWLALLLPLFFLAAAAVVVPVHERRLIGDELRAEDEAVAAAEDVELVTRPFARRALYARLLLARDVDGWFAIRRLHDRLVQLALVKARAARSEDEETRTRLEVEVLRLREAALVAQRDVEVVLHATDSHPRALAR